MMFQSMNTFWVGAIVVFLLVEAAAPGLVSIWFAFGAAAGLVSSLFNAPVWLQFVWFAVVSVVCLFLTRPFAKKYVNSKTTPTNADMVIGADCVVTERIDNTSGSGAVSVGGREWTARSAEPAAVFEKDSIVTVLRIEGVKLIVKEKI